MTKTVGLILGLTGNVLQSLGLVLQKFGHVKLATFNEQNQKTQGYLNSKLWLYGLIIMIIGCTINGISLGFAGQVILAPLLIGSLLIYAILSIFILKEPWNIFDIISYVFIILGISVIIINGPTNEIKYQNPSDLFHRFSDTKFLIFMGITTLLTMIFNVYTRYIQYMNIKNIMEYGYNNHIETSKKIIELTKYDPSKSKVYLGIMTYITAYFGSVSMLCLKIALKSMGITPLFLFTGKIMCILRVYFGGTFRDDIFLYILGVFWIGIIGFILSGIWMEKFRQNSLKLFNAMYTIPIYQIILTILSVFFGEFFFNEFKNVSSKDLAFYILGILSCILGVFILTLSNVVNKYKHNRYIGLTEQRLLKGIDIMANHFEPRNTFYETVSERDNDNDIVNHTINLNDVNVSKDTNDNTQPMEIPYFSVGISLRVLKRQLYTKKNMGTHIYIRPKNKLSQAFNERDSLELSNLSSNNE